jgi:endonuclease YncB( thermonuclease family)
MKKIIVAISLLAVALSPSVIDAVEFPEHLVGRVVIDVSSNGEAWYVNPSTQMRVYLGRPDEALERLIARATYVNYMSIARIAPDNGKPENSDSEYLADVGGAVIAPNDVIGAAWYVDPDRGVRRRLANANDAWLIMRDAVPVTAADLSPIPVEGLDNPRYERVRVSEIVDAVTILLEDGRTIELASLSVPDNEDLQLAAMERLQELLLEREVVMERGSKSGGSEGLLKRFLHADNVNVNCDLVRRGLAFDEISFPHFLYAEQLIVSRLDAMRHGNGFWASN